MKNEKTFIEEVYEAISAELGSGIPTSEQIVAAAKAAAKFVCNDAIKCFEEHREKADVSSYRDGVNDGINRCVSVLELLKDLSK